VQPGPDPRRFISYPSRQVLAVLDDEASADAAVAGLRATGVDAADVLVLRGPDDAARLDGAGSAHGWRARLRRLFAFTLMDQLPDFILYERAVRDGRTVLAVRVDGEARKRAVHAVLRAHGAHFTNYYGRLATEELDLWRGPEPDIPGVLRR
jgi:hypothetical protein